jgi:GNAT superfamily N-acetyltransferase
MGWRFAEGYREQAELDDGTEIELRLLCPEDAPLLAEGFRKLSPASRYRRFLSARSELSERELHYLTCCDGETHFALGALRRDGGEGLGVARFVRLAGQAGVAEPAITVIDSMQGKGLGRLLLRRLVAAARERGIEAFRCPVLMSNEPVRVLIEQAAPHVRTVPLEPDVVELQISLDDMAGEEAPAREHPLYRMFIAAAAGVLVLAHGTMGLGEWLARSAVGPTKSEKADS